jgi:hypothetical protein
MQKEVSFPDRFAKIFLAAVFFQGTKQSRQADQES